MQNWLFVSHDASLTGAPILLFNLAKLLREDLQFEIDFMLLKSGALDEQFKKLGTTHALYKSSQKISDRAIGFIHKEYTTNLTKFRWKEYDAVLVNTVASLEALPLIRKKFNGPVVCYIHELKAIKDFFLSPESFAKIDSLINFYLVPSNAVENFLANECGIEISKIRMLPYFIPPSIGMPIPERKASSEYFTVGGCGRTELRKGSDLFVQVARLFKDKYPRVPVKFVWKGARESSLDYRLLQEDVRKLDLDKTVTFDAASVLMSQFYHQLDVFLLPSREDPYPLVVLEAANAKVPTICFEKAGGAVEFVATDAGKIVNFLDLHQMAEAIHFYCTNKSKVAEDGACAFERVRERHQNRTAIVNEFLQVINSLG